MAIDHLHLALARYHHLRPEKASRYHLITGAALGDWVDRDVCPIVEDLLGRERFREAARWPLEQLEPSSTSEMRRIVEAVDVGIVAWAQTLAAFARQLLHSRGDTSAIDRANQAVGALDYIAQRPWRDLVAESDYFYPRAELNLCDRASYVGPAHRCTQIGEFLRFLNPRLRLPGDFVTRAMVTRIKYWKNRLERFSLQLENGRPVVTLEVDSAAAASVAARDRLFEAYQRLEERCEQSHGARIRDSVMALVQVFAAYRPNVNWNWLNLRSTLASTAAAFRREIECDCATDLTDRVAQALLDVAPIYRACEEPTDEIEAKSRQFRLLLVMARGARQVYWEGNPVEADWESREKPWALFCALAEQAKCNSAVDGYTLGGSKPVQLKYRRADLKNLLPSELDALIKPAGPGTYRLHLSPDEVCVVAQEESETLVEQSPSFLGMLNARDWAARR